MLLMSTKKNEQISINDLKIIQEFECLGGPPLWAHCVTSTCFTL